MKSLLIQKRLTAYQIRKAILGIIISDGYIDKNYRMEVYNKNKEFIEHVGHILSNITNLNYKINEISKDKYKGYKLFTTKHPYFRTLYNKMYIDRKRLNKYIINRVNEITLAYIWMCDGYLEHNKNRNKNKIQNIGYFCLESFDYEELDLLKEYLLNKFNINSQITQCEWGFGFRIKLSGKDLQKFISMIYPYILPCYEYKTQLFYKTLKYVDITLPNAEYIFKTYTNIEDIKI